MSLPPTRKPRRRRRRHNSAVRRTPEQLRLQGQRKLIRTSQLLSVGAVVVICIALIALIWINTERSVREQREDALGRVEGAIAAQAATLAIQVQHELLMVDQSLAVLQEAWNANPEAFNLADWRSRMPALTDVADDLFIADDKHMIVQDILPAAIGQGIGSAYATFANGSLEPIQTGRRNRDNQMLVGELGEAGVVRQYLMYLVRPLTKPAGWIIGASYRSGLLGKAFASAGLGHGGLAALIDTHRGGVQAVAGIAAVRPTLSIGDTPMYQTMVDRPDGGIWIGRTTIDGVQRIMAFRRVQGRDLIVLVGVDAGDAMTPADGWAAAARSLAVIASLLVIGIAATVLWEMWHWRRTRHRRRVMAQTEELLAGTQSDLAALRARSALESARLRTVLANVYEAVAVIDGDHRLALWNPYFAGWCHLPSGVLAEGLPVDQLVRQQALAGHFGASDDIEAEIARRVALLWPERGTADVNESAPDGTPLVLRTETLADGGLVLVLRRASAVPAVAAEAQQPAPAATAQDPAGPEEPTAADPVEW